MSCWLEAYFSLGIALEDTCDVGGRKLLVSNSKLTTFFYLGALDSRLEPAFKIGDVGDKCKEDECLLEILIQLQTQESLNSADTCRVFSFSTFPIVTRRLVQDAHDIARSNLIDGRCWEQ